MILSKVKHALEEEVRRQLGDADEQEVSRRTVERYEKYLKLNNKEGLSVFDECKRSKNYSFKQFIQEYDIQKEEKSHLLVVEAAKAKVQYCEQASAEDSPLNELLKILESKDYLEQKLFRSEFECPYDLRRPLLP